MGVSNTHFTDLSNSQKLLEYINKLRQQCRVGERNANHQYLDAVVHWKERFKDSQVEILNLRRKLVRLEREIETLKSTSTVTETSELPGSTRSRQKRTSRDEPNLPPGKRTKTSSSNTTSNDHLYKDLQQDFRVLESSDYGEYECDETTSSLVLMSISQAKQLSITYGKHINPTDNSTQILQYWHIISTKLHTMLHDML